MSIYSCLATIYTGMKHTTKILFIVKKRHNYGCETYGSVGLHNSSTFVCNRLNKDRRIKAEVVEAIDGNCIDRLVTQNKPHIVILEALWVTPDKIEQLMKLHKKPRFVIRVHSKAPFIANEGMAFEWMSKYKQLMKTYHNLFFASNSHQFCDELLAIDMPCLYLPNIYDTGYNRCDFKSREVMCHAHHELHIGCFGAIRPMKNHVQQAIAAIMFAEKLDMELYFHVNGTRQEMNGQNVMKNLRGLFSGVDHTLVEHPWYTHKQFSTQVVPTMDLGMQVSLSETFNIVTADFVMAGVPIVVSEEVDWMPNRLKSDPNSSADMVDKLERAYSHPWMYSMWSKMNLHFYNTGSEREWMKFVFPIT